MPIYFGFAETLDKTTNKWATPANAPTCNAQGWNGSTPTDLGAVTPVAWATGRYYALKDTGATVYQEVTFAFTTADADYADATSSCIYDPVKMGLTAARVTLMDNMDLALTTLRGADSDTLETLSDQMDGIATWTAAAVSSSITAGSITQIKGNTWNFDIEDLTLDDNLIQLSIKTSKSKTDAESILMIDTTIGLLYVNGKVGTAGDASLSYTGTTLTVVVDASVTDDLEYSSCLYYGIQSITAGGVVSEVYGGTFVITNDVVKAVE